MHDVSVTFHGLYVDAARVIVEETLTATLIDDHYGLVFELRDSPIHRVRDLWTRPAVTA